MSAPRDGLREQIMFSMVPVWVLERCSSQAVHVYAFLMKHANRERRAWPKTELLATEMGKSLRTVERAIAELRTRGAIQTQRRHAKNGAVLGLDFVLMQIPPALVSLPATAGGMAVVTLPAADGGNGVDHPAISVAAIPPDLTELKREPDPFNQIQEESTALPRVFGGVEPDPTDPCDVFRCTWNATVTEPLKRVATLTPKRRRAIRAALAAHPLATWVAIFARVTTSRFCRGEKGWLASFDWIIATPDAAVKVLEGQYDDVARAPARVDVGLLARAWDCPHDPKCEQPGNWRCHQKTQLDAARERTA